MEEILDNEAVHTFFGLSYASYMVLPRVALQSMPEEWQRDFVKRVEQLNEDLVEYNQLEPEGYRVTPVDSFGKFTKNKWTGYRHNKLTYRGQFLKEAEPLFTYCIEVQRESRDDDFTTHGKFKSNPSQQDVLDYLEDEGIFINLNYARLNYYLVK